MLLPFRNVTRAPAQEWLVTGGPIMLAASLGQFRDLSIVPEERLVAVLRRASMPTDGSPDATQLRRIANETGAWTAVSGTIIGTGGKIRLGAQALDIATSQVLTRVEAEIAADADVRLAFDTLAARLLAITGITTTNTVDLGGLTTRSVDAFRDYVSGMDALRRAEGRLAIDAFNRAVRRDSTFALAWARLGLAMIVWETQGLIDLRSQAYAAIERASRLADRVPTRELRIIRAIRSAAAGQIVAAKSTLDSMITADASDVEAREYRALTEMYDRVIVDTLAMIPRLRGSWNDAVRMFEDVLQRDPGRGSAYALLTSLYMFAAGGATGHPGIAALRREPTSLAALLAPNISVTVMPVVRDSIEFLSNPGWQTLPPGEAKRLQRRAAEAARRWTDRWLATSPSNGHALVSSAILAERLGEFDRSLAELARIDTTTVTVLRPADIFALRVRGLMGLGRMDEAVRLADSIRGTALANRPIDDGLARLAIASHLIAKRWDAAAAVADTALRRSNVRAPACAFLPVIGHEWIWPLARSLRAQVMDTVAAHILEASNAPSLASCSLLLATGLARDSIGMKREFALTRAFAQFDSVAAIPGPRADASLIGIGMLVRGIDSSSVARLGASERYVRLANEWSMFKRFTPAGVIVSGDSVSVGFRWISPEAGVWDLPGSLIAWNLRAHIRIGQGADTVGALIYADHPHTPRDAPMRGGVAEAAAALTMRGAGVPYAVGGLSRTSWPGEVRLEGDVIRIVVKGELAAEIRRSRPATARFGLVNCGVVTGGLCASPTVPIDYR